MQAYAYIKFIFCTLEILSNAPCFFGYLLHTYNRYNLWNSISRIIHKNNKYFQKKIFYFTFHFIQSWRRMKFSTKWHGTLTKEANQRIEKKITSRIFWQQSPSKNSQYLLSFDYTTILWLHVCLVFPFYYCKSLTHIRII